MTIWELLAWVLLVGAALGRAVRLVVNDAFPFGPFQAWLEESYEDTWLQLMLSCPWCLSGWLSLAATVGLEARGSLLAPPVAWGAIWWVTVATYWLAETLASVGAEDDEPPVEFVDDGEFTK